MLHLCWDIFLLHLFTHIFYLTLIQMNREKLMKMAGSVRTGGKGTVRRWINIWKSLPFQVMIILDLSWFALQNSLMDLAHVTGDKHQAYVDKNSFAYISASLQPYWECVTNTSNIFFFKWNINLQFWMHCFKSTSLFSTHRMQRLNLI